MKHLSHKYYNVYINHDPVMTLTYFRARSTWVAYAFEWVKLLKCHLKGKTLVLIFDPKHIVGTCYIEPPRTVCVLSKNIKNIKILQMIFLIFACEKILCMFIGWAKFGNEACRNRFQSTG